MIIKETEIFSEVWSYAIYGDDYEKYYQPMIANITLAKALGVHLVINTNEASEDNVRDFFFDYKNDIQLIVYSGKVAELFPKVLRFLTVDKLQSSFYFFKDSDSIVNQKEISIMRHWISSLNPVALIIRDHPLHIAPIMAGMIGMTRNTALVVSASARDCFGTDLRQSNNSYSYDQDWLAEKIYPLISKQSLIATSYFYFAHENYIAIKKEHYEKDCIGAQAYKKDFETIVSSCFYNRLYKNSFLCLPFCNALSFVYGKVRPTLLLAYIYTNLIKFKER